MKKLVGFILVVIVLGALNYVVGTDILGNLALGIVSALISLAVTDYYGYDPTALVGVIFLAAFLIPLVGNAAWFVWFGAHQMTLGEMEQWLYSYLHNDVFQPLPSVIVGIVGGAIITEFSSS